MFRYGKMDILLGITLTFFSLFETYGASRSDGSAFTIDTTRKWTESDAQKEYYYPHNFLSDDRLLVFAGCSMAKFPSKIPCNVTALSFDLKYSKSCPILLSSNGTTELTNTMVELHRLGVSKMLMTWWTLKKASGRSNLPSVQSRQIAIVDFNSCSVSRNTIAHNNHRPSYVLPFRNYYEFVYFNNSNMYMSRKRFDLQHKEINNTDKFLALDSHDVNSNHGGFAWQTLIIPNSQWKLSSAWEKRYLIVEGSPTAAKINYANPDGMKKSVAVVKKFSEDHFSTRHGLLAVCGELIVNQTSRVQCRQYDVGTNSELRMNVTLKGLSSIQNLIRVENIIGGGLLVLKNGDGNTYLKYKFVKVHLNETEETLIENISLDCDFSSPKSRVEISNFGDEFCVHSSCPLQKDDKNNGKVTEFEIFRTCRVGN